MGGYDAVGIDSALFSQALCISIASLARAAASAEVDPKVLLASGHEQVDGARIKSRAPAVCLGVYKTDGGLSVAKWVSNGATLSGGC